MDRHPLLLALASFAAGLNTALLAFAVPLQLAAGPIALNAASFVGNAAFVAWYLLGRRA